MAAREVAVSVLLAPCAAREVARSISCVAVSSAFSAGSVSLLTTLRLFVTCVLRSRSARICMSASICSGESEGWEIFRPEDTWRSAVLICDCTFEISARNNWPDGLTVGIIVDSPLLDHIDGRLSQLIQHRDHFRIGVVSALKLDQQSRFVIQRYAGTLASQIACLRDGLLLNV